MKNIKIYKRYFLSREVASFFATIGAIVLAAAALVFMGYGVISQWHEHSIFLGCFMIFLLALMARLGCLLVPDLMSDALMDVQHNIHWVNIDLKEQGIIPWGEENDPALPKFLKY